MKLLLLLLATFPDEIPISRRNDPQRNLAFGNKEVNSKLVGKVGDVGVADVQKKYVSAQSCWTFRSEIWPRVQGWLRDMNRGLKITPREQRGWRRGLAT